MDHALLEEIGLTKGEVKTYLALCKLGSSSTGPLAKESGVSRSKLYGILDKLSERGLVSHVIKRDVKYFQATEPERILSYMDEREKKLQEQKQRMKEILPMFAHLGASPDTRVEVFEGFKGVTTAFEHFYRRLAKGEMYHVSGTLAQQEKKWHIYWQKDHVRRARAGIKCQILFNHDTAKEVMDNRNSFWGCDARLMKEGIQTPSWFMVYKNVTVIMLQGEAPIAIEIVNEHIANSFKMYFDAQWKETTPWS